MKPQLTSRPRRALAFTLTVLLAAPALRAEDAGTTSVTTSTTTTNEAPTAPTTSAMTTAANRLARFSAGAEQFARNRAGEAHDLLVGPPPRPAVEIPRDLDCQALYRRRVALMQEQALTNKGPFWDDPRNRASMYIGTVWTPAFAYLPVRAITDFYTAEHAPQRQAEVDALRDQSASQRCFER